MFSLTLFNAELNPICHLLALLGAQPILHVSRVRVNYALRKIVKKKRFLASPCVSVCPRVRQREQLGSYSTDFR